MSRSQSVAVRYRDVILVCRECSGDAKRIAKTLKHAVHAFEPRPRVVRTSCLDVCPKRDVCVTYLGSGTLVARVVDEDGVAPFVEDIRSLRS